MFRAPLVDRLLRMQSGTGLRPEEREVTVLFTDIAGFTELSRRLTPLRLAAFLNRHFEMLGGAIDAEGGTIDKYNRRFGDGILGCARSPTRSRTSRLSGGVGNRGSFGCE
jgi:adenylate cyclase